MIKNHLLTKKIHKFGRLSGFAIPTVLMASIIMLTVLVVSISSVVAIRVGLRDQYYNLLASNASDAGSAYAEACLSANNGVPLWSDVAPLKPSTDCSGVALAGLTCTTNSTDPRCSVAVNTGVIANFSVGLPQLDANGKAINITVNSTTNLTRTSDNSTWRSYPKTRRTNKIYNGGPRTWSQIDGGCGIGSDNLGYCWGNNANGRLGNNSTTQSLIPVAVDTSGVLSGKTIKSIASGSAHTCVIASDNLAYCWGKNDVGQLGDNSTTQRLVPVAVNTAGVLSGKTIKSISVNNSHTCVIASDNLVYCWGLGTYGELGNNSTANSSIPVAVNTAGVLSGKTVKSIVAGGLHTCAIASDNLLYCWGLDANGQLGNNSTTQSPVPVAVNTAGVLSGKTIKSITAGDLHTCAVASNNLAYCWGLNSDGRLGDNSAIQRLVPVAVDTTGVLNGKTIRSIAAGDVHTCAVASDNLAYCWGANASGQLGDNSTTQRLVPVAVNTAGVLNGKTINSIDAMGPLTCVVASDTLVYCWGIDTNGQLGNGLTTNSSVPVITNTTGYMVKKTFVSFGVSGPYTCGVASDYQAYCWGYNNYGQLGNNSTTQSNVPVAVNTAGVLSGKTIKSIAAGNYHACALASDNLVYCWGYNLYGQLGNNSTTDSPVPVAVNMSGVLSGKTIKSIASGSYHTCAIASDNLEYCWGYNALGQLGNNSIVDSHVPVAVNTAGVLSGKTINSISAGGHNACAIASDNLAYCWGGGTHSQLGNNAIVDSHVPVAVYTAGVLSGKTINSIATGSYNSCVIASNNLPYCWGANDVGEIGDNTINESSVPVAVNTAGVLNGKTVSNIATGSTTCVVASDNLLYCWGWNSYGQLGNNSINDSWVPIAVDTTGVLNGKTVRSVMVSSWGHSCAIASDYKIYCVGSNTYGQLGNNSTTESHVHVAVSPLASSLYWIYNF